MEKQIYNFIMSNRLSNCDGIACLVCGLLIQMKVYPTTPPPLGNWDIIRKKQAQRTDVGVIHLNNL